MNNWFFEFLIFMSGMFCCGSMLCIYVSDYFLGTIMMMMGIGLFFTAGSYEAEKEVEQK